MAQASPSPLSFVGLLQLSGFQGTKGDTKSGGAMRGRTRRSPRSPLAFAIPEATATEVWLQKWTWLFQLFLEVLSDCMNMKKAEMT